MDKNAKIYIAGHCGLVGSALVRGLKRLGYHNLLLRNQAELNLIDQQATNQFFTQEQPDYVFIAAARVGGIYANDTYRAEFIYENLMIEANIIHAAYLCGVKKLLFLGSSCIYPRDCPQPIKEEYLLTGILESTNEPYAIAKIAGIKMCENYNRQYGTHFIAAMPTNLYGPNDNYDLKNGHVVPALIRKTHEAKLEGKKELIVWGTGTPKREFMYVDDMADACIFIMNHGLSHGIINIGTGEDLSIQALTQLIMEIVGFEGKLIFDTSKPDGTPRKLLNIDRLRALGWQPSMDLKQGIIETYHAFLKANELSLEVS